MNIRNVVVHVHVQDHRWHQACLDITKNTTASDLVAAIIDCDTSVLAQKPALHVKPLFGADEGARLNERDTINHVM
jgi:hypothetical protein